MNRVPHPRLPLNPCSTFVAVVLILSALSSAADDRQADRHPDERDGAATIIHRSDVIRNRGTNGGNSAPMRLWPLLSTPEARMNYVEIAGPSSLHFHPDADHRLYVLEGSVVVTAGTNTTTATAGDLIIIPKGVRHSYDVPAKGDRALLLTFDAPPYDPRKTVNIGSSPRPSGEGPRK
jgi:quercetin dioxygenase-like cupin family protein